MPEKLSYGILEDDGVYGTVEDTGKDDSVLGIGWQYLISLIMVELCHS
jgi:hypothetical protein